MKKRIAWLVCGGSLFALSAISYAAGPHPHEGDPHHRHPHHPIQGPVVVPQTHPHLNAGHSSPGRLNHHPIARHPSVLQGLTGTSTIASHSLAQSHQPMHRPMISHLAAPPPLPQVSSPLPRHHSIIGPVMPRHSQAQTPVTSHHPPPPHRASQPGTIITPPTHHSHNFDGSDEFGNYPSFPLFFPSNDAPLNSGSPNSSGNTQEDDQTDRPRPNQPLLMPSITAPSLPAASSNASPRSARRIHHEKIDPAEFEEDSSLPPRPAVETPPNLGVPLGPDEDLSHGLDDEIKDPIPLSKFPSETERKEKLMAGTLSPVYTTKHYSPQTLYERFAQKVSQLSLREQGLYLDALARCLETLSHEGKHVKLVDLAEDEDINLTGFDFGSHWIIIVGNIRENDRWHPFRGSLNIQKPESSVGKWLPTRTNSLE